MPTTKTLISNGVGLWIHQTGNAIGHLHDIQNIGFDYILIKISDGSQGANTYHLDDAARIQKDANSINLPVAFWTYLVPDNIQGQITATLKGLPAGATDLVIDAEIEFEQAPSKIGKVETLNRIKDYCTGILKARPNIKLHLSSFWSVKFHASLPFGKFSQYCATLQPQCYLQAGSKRTAESILSNSLKEYRTISTTVPIVPTINNVEFLPLLKAKGIKNCNVYVWDPEGDAQVSVSKTQWTEAIQVFKS